MCIGACYSRDNQIIITHFAQAGAKLPIRKSATHEIIIPWGRRKKEPGKLPLGGWASLDSIQQGKWDQYFPQIVKLPIHKFLEEDYEKHSIWFDITPGQWIQGLYIQEQAEQRVYIVTLTPQMPEATFSRWPRIIQG